MKIDKTKILLGILLISALILVHYFALSEGYLKKFTDTHSLNLFIKELGLWGPLGIICLMTLAVVFSPIPSAPIAVTSGLLYGKWWGTAYIVIGAELGAIIAFTIARCLGYEVLKKWFGEKLNSGLLSSQRDLTLIVFVSRLLPFVSFDILSYAAGLTRLSFLRFIIATFLGILPVSFLLAYFGYELKANDSRFLAIIFSLGLITAIPFIVGAVRSRIKPLQ